MSILSGKSNNEIDRTRVLFDFKKFKPSLSYDHLKVNGMKSKFVEFGESNSFLLTNAKGDDEKVQTRFDFDDYDISFFDDNVEIAPQPTKRKRTDFPETWLFECFKADKTGVAFKNTIVPDTITSWKFSGFSIDPDKGLRLFKPTTLNVKLNFFLKLNLPYSIRRGEILKVDVLIFNYIERKINTSVKIDFIGSPTFEILEKLSKCSVKASVERNESKTVSVASNSVGHAVFFIRAIETGKIKLHIKAEGQEIAASDEIVKELLVEHDGVTVYKNRPIWFDLTKGSFNMTPFTPIFSQEAILKSIKIGGTLIGDLLGPAVLDVSKLM